MADTCSVCVTQSYCEAKGCAHDDDTLYQECPVCLTEGVVEHTCNPAPLVHRVLKGYLDEGELAVAWVLTIDVAGPDDTRYLAHRAGGGLDGTEAPMAWTALGMLRASMGLAEDQLLEMTAPEAEDE